ncbi:sulfurtransferase TusA family protein [Francisellaceae bacterium CB299]|jgi:TusA-related sulfurtransferase
MKELSLERLLCPMPVIKTQNMLKTMKKGEQLKVICTDPGTMHDIPAWCKVNDYKLVEAIEINNKYQFIVEVK